MVEPVLVDVAREYGGDMRLGMDCVSVEQDGDGVTTILKDRQTGAVSTVRAEYLNSG